MTTKRPNDRFQRKERQGNLLALLAGLLVWLAWLACTPAQAAAPVMTAVSLSQNHMSWHLCWNFSLRQDEDNPAVFLLSASFFADEAERRIELDEVPADAALVRAVQNLISEHQVQNWQSSKIAPLPFIVRDASTWHFAARFSNGASMSAGSGYQISGGDAGKLRDALLASFRQHLTPP